MSHHEAALGRGYSAVGAAPEQLLAMLALDERNSTVRAMCVELARATGKPSQWRMVRLIGPAIGQDEAAVDAAIAHAVEQGWLLAAGNPAHSICLTDAGRALRARLAVELARRSPARSLHSLKERIVGQSYNGKQGGCC